MIVLRYGDVDGHGKKKKKIDDEVVEYTCNILSQNNSSVHARNSS